MKIGYARVSTHEQTLDLQIDQLQAAGCAPDITPTPTRKVLSSSPGLERPASAGHWPTRGRATSSDPAA